ncbi:MAG: hypothetical protein PF501_07890 [Salinisphaera sp.]|jgi:hypothetical protein|nr:hypothetical protein [Salinisphaera sp.]
MSVSPKNTPMAIRGPRVFDSRMSLIAEAQLPSEQAKPAAGTQSAAALWAVNFSVSLYLATLFCPAKQQQTFVDVARQIFLPRHFRRRNILSRGSGAVELDEFLGIEFRIWLGFLLPSHMRHRVQG